jgi:hypothetical protein
MKGCVLRGKVRFAKDDDLSIEGQRTGQRKNVRKGVQAT